MAITVATKAPSGLSISRNGNVLSMQWKISDANYNAGQQFQYRFNNEAWKTATCFINTTSKAVTVPIASYYPTTSKYLHSVSFRVRGKRGQYQTGSGSTLKTYQPSWSSWTEKTYSLNYTNIPSLSSSKSDSVIYQTTFTWNTTIATNTTQFFTNNQYQSMLVKDSNITDGSKLAWKSSQKGWKAGTVTSSSSMAITEESDVVATGSWTRWFRIRSRGPKGVSAWKYAKHVYALPYQAAITKATAQQSTSGGYNCYVVWSASQPVSHPIDETTVQYLKAVPDANLTCPTDGVSWTDGATLKDTAGADAARFSLDGQLADDQCLFVRVNTEHDRLNEYGVTYGKPTLASVGYLKDPQISSVTTDSQTYRATITATNNSDVDDAFLAITYMGSNDPTNAFIVGIIPPGETSVTVQCPDWSEETNIAFGVQAVVGSYKATTRADGASSYAVTKRMQSKNIVWNNGNVPQAPANVAVSATEIAGTARVTWDWSWKDATSAEISWADHADAWESTAQPSVYEISNLHASAWNIAGLTPGLTYYIRVRLKAGTGDDATAGPWSEPVTIDLSSAPTIPVLYLSQSTITADGEVTASWAYSTTDGTAQAYAEICQATIDASGITYGEPIAHTQTAQHITLSAEDLGWESGNIYNLCVRVTSASGRVSDSWSDSVAVTVAEPLTCMIAQTSLEQVTITTTDEEDETVTRTAIALIEMPLTVTVTGAGAGGTTIVAIERAESYFMDRPDEVDFNGYEGETVALISQMGEDQIAISLEDLIGSIDDGAKYRIVATVQDGLGQSASDSIDFEVVWSDQAIIPDAIAEIDGYIAKITPKVPEGAGEGATCDIYRLSADRPELIVEDAAFGTTYVDPYPAIGEYGGHRVVYKTANGDYITEDMQPAWIDLRAEDGDILQLEDSIIDFDGYILPITYNAELSTSFGKEFNETAYLGGSIQGDWNLATSRSSTIKAVATTQYDAETIQVLRRLATYPGICHVRTKDGSSYAADVQVSDSLGYSSAGKAMEFDLSITRVDPETLDGLTLDEWLNEE